MMIGQKKKRAAHVFKRDPLDYYREPESCSEALFRAENFIGEIYDPACGSGAIVRSAIKAGYGAYGSDIKRRTTESWFTREIDFLTEPLSTSSAAIVTNPPYYAGKGTEQFIRRALSFTTNKVCVFTSIRFLAGSGRANGIYHEFPPQRVWVLNPRPSCPPGEWLDAGNKAGGGTEDYVWLVWCRSAPSRETRIGWLNTKESVE